MRDRIRVLIATYHAAKRAGRPELQAVCISDLKAMFGLSIQTTDSVVITFARMRLVDNFIVPPDQTEHVPYRDDFFDEDLFRL